jgi:8-oxo-dGTP pyrophosphatase MutT (NUDIX family)
MARPHNRQTVHDTEEALTDRPGRAVFSAASAAFIVRPEDGRVLLVHHRKSSKWVLPGGKSAWDEPPRMTCEREAVEELGGVGVRVGRLLVLNWLTKAAELFPGAASDEYAYPCYMTTFHVTLTDPSQPVTVPPNELHAYRWWDLEEAVGGGAMEPYNALNLQTAWTVLSSDGSTAYLES